MANLLVNGSFDGGWTSPPGDANQIPNGWTFWYATPDIANPFDANPWSVWRKPEMVHRDRPSLPPEEWPLFFWDDGQYTLKVFKGTGSVWFKLTQQVNIDAGRYRLSVNFYSDVYQWEGHKVPAPDPNSGRMRFVVSGGVTDWFTFAPFLERESISYEFDCPGGCLTTVGAEFMFPFAISNNGIFADGWTLERIGDLPHDDECRGAPRVQYARAYNVIPSDATEEQAIAIFREGWRRSRETAGGSYDDAGIGDLDSRTANLYNIPSDRRIEFAEWYDDHYPGVSVQFKPMPGGGDPFELPQPAELLSLHMQGDEVGWDAFVSQVQPEMIKFVGAWQRAAFVRSVSPHTQIIARWHCDDQHVYYQNPDKRAAARAFLAHCYDDMLANGVHCIESLNEEYPSYNLDKLRAVRDFDIAFLDELEARGDGVKGVVGIAAVGNPGHDEVEELLPLARKVYRGGHYLGPHPYFPASPDHAEQWLENEGLHHHLRPLLSWDPVFSANGIYPMYVFTECGAIGAYVRPDGRPGGYVSAESGWKAQETLRADWARYLSLLLAWRAQLMEWNASHGNRCRGATVFTVKSNWVHFLLNEPELMALGAALKG